MLMRDPFIKNVNFLFQVFPKCNTNNPVVDGWPRICIIKVRKTIGVMQIENKVISGFITKLKDGSGGKSSVIGKIILHTAAYMATINQVKFFFSGKLEI